MVHAHLPRDSLPFSRAGIEKFFRVYERNGKYVW